MKRNSPLRKRCLIARSSHVKNSRRASALLEVLLVVAGMGIMCGLLIPTVRHASDLEESRIPAVIVASSDFPTR